MQRTNKNNKKDTNKAKRNEIDAQGRKKKVRSKRIGREETIVGLG